MTEAEICEDIPHNSWIAELCEDIPIWAELRKRKFVKTFLSEQSGRSGNSWRHSYLSRVAEAEICEDIPHNSWIAEIREDIPIWAELQKRKFVKTFLSEWSYGSRNSWRHSYLSRVAEAEIREDIPIWAEWRKRKFVKTFPITVELRKFVKTFLSERSYRSRNSWRHSYLSGVTEAEIREDIPIWVELRKRKFMKTFLSEQSYWSRNSWRHSYLSGVTEIREDISIWAELRKRKFVKTFLSEQSYGRGNSWRHSYLSRVTEAEICEDIPHNSWIAELCEDIPIWAELRKRKFVKTFLSEQSGRSGNSWRHSYLRRVAEAEICEDIPHNSWIAEIREDIPIWAELQKRKFVKTFLSEWSYGSGNSWRHSYLSGVPLRKITSFSTASAQLSKLRRSFVKASGIGTCVFSCRNAAFTQSWRKAGFSAALTKSCRKAGFYAAFAKL